MSEMKILTTTEINADDCYCTGECSYLFTQGTNRKMEFVCSLYEKELGSEVYGHCMDDAIIVVKRCFQCVKAEQALASAKGMVTE
jgi:hypothetical protein